MLDRLHIVITKSERKLELFDGEILVRTYPVSLGFCPLGTKEMEGDGRTPEGEYYVFVKNPESKFSRGLGISYPGPRDAREGLQNGVISRDEYDAIVTSAENSGRPPQKTALGGEIYIHGGGCEDDWTRGCVGLSDADIREIFEKVDVGCPVKILA